MKKYIKILSLILLATTLFSVFAVSTSAAVASYPMSCTIYYKDESGNSLLPAYSFTVNASDQNQWGNGRTSPTISGYSLKYSSDSYVSYEMMDKNFPASNYIRNGTATYTVVYVKDSTHTVYYIYGENYHTASPSVSRSGRAGTSYSISSPSITGYRPTSATVSGTFGTTNTSTTVYYYLQTYTVSYSASGGSGAPASQTKTYGINLTLSSTTPTKSGYTFVGWATSPGSSNIAYLAGSIYTGNSNVNLYAVWEQNAVAPATYTIIYNANGGIGGPASQTKTKDVSLTLSSTLPTRDGYICKGWSTSSTATNATYQPGGTYTSNSSATLYAVWKSNTGTSTPSVTTYTVTYNANGGSGAPSSQTKTKGVDLHLSYTIPTRSGYTFEGWSKSSSSAHVFCTPGEYYTDDADLNLYAVWTKNSTSSTSPVTPTPSTQTASTTSTGRYTVYFDANGGSGGPSSITADYGETIEIPYDEPYKYGYNFISWIASTDGQYYNMGDTMTVYSNVTMTALWYTAKVLDDIPTTTYYTISYNANGGTGAPSSQTKTQGIDLRLSSVIPTRSGYAFAGWSTSSSSSHVYYTPGEYYTEDADLSLYAVWESTTLTTYTISYNANGGSGAPSSQVKTHGVSLTLSSVKPTRTGYTFLGWSTSSSATSATYSAGGSYTANASATLYAVWSANTYTISYNANGGSGAPASQTKTHGVVLTLSSTKPTKTGYTFLGWSTSSTATSATYSAGGSYTANASVTLYAVWQKITYNFTISNLTATPNEVYKGGNTHVSFNLKLTCIEAKSGIPVEVYYDGTLVYSANLNFSANGTNLVAFDLNVGSSIGQKTLTARVNFSDRTNETNSSDNSASVTVNVKKYIETSSNVVPISGTYIEGMDVISSFFAENGGSEDILPSDNMSFGFEVYEMNGTSETLVLSQKKNNTVIPANGSNLVYFKWTIPSDSAGKTYMVRGTMNADGKTNEVNTDNNSSFFTILVNDKEDSQTPDTRYERNAPSTYSKKTQTPATNICSVSWNEWEYDSATNALVLKKYGVSISNAPTVDPDTECKTATKSGDVWTLKSGYGITISWKPTLTTPSGCIKAKADSVTNAQLAYARFPEFAYSSESGSYRILESVDGTFAFIENSDAVNDARVHFIPVYVADGDYTVSCTASQIWTPAGMITVTQNANTVKINGTIYDDWAKE